MRAIPAATAGAVGSQRLVVSQACRGLPWLATFRYPLDSETGYFFPRSETFVHVTEDHLRQLAEDRLPAGDRQRVVRHLLTACPSCLELAREVLFPEQSRSPTIGRAAASRALRGPGVDDVAVETASPARCGTASSPGSRPARGSWRSGTTPTCTPGGSSICSWPRRKGSRAISLWRASTSSYAALAVADLLSPEVYGEERIHDLRASAWAFLGNLKRLAGDFSRGLRRRSAPRPSAWPGERRSL